MNLEKAIRVKEEEIVKPFSHSLAAIDKAERLGIEALKFVQGYSLTNDGLLRPLLPGETKE